LVRVPDVLEKAAHVEPHTVVDTPTALDLVSYFKPIRERKVDCFSNIESKIKASMVARDTRYHEFALSMNRLGHVNFIINQETWVDQSSLVSYELWAVFCLFGELSPQEIFKFLIAVEINPVPEFRSPMMQVVD
jgi:hypothetical protein